MLCVNERVYGWRNPLPLLLTLPVFRVPNHGDPASHKTLGYSDSFRHARSWRKTTRLRPNVGRRNCPTTSEVSLYDWSSNKRVSSAHVGRIHPCISHS